VTNKQDMRIEKDWQIAEGVGQNMPVNVESIRLKKMPSFLLDGMEDGLAKRQARTSGERQNRETWHDAKFWDSAARKEQSRSSEKSSWPPRLRLLVKVRSDEGAESRDEAWPTLSLNLQGTGLLDSFQGLESRTAAVLRVFSMRKRHVG
jgi:hypothetical protein